MKKRNKKVSLVAHVTVRGLESIKRGRIDLSDPRLDGEPGTVQLELHTDRRTARQMQHEIMAARALFNDEWALKHLDEAFIKPWRVIIAQVTSGDPDIDGFVRRTAKAQGHDLKVATLQN